MTDPNPADGPLADSPAMTSTRHLRYEVRCAGPVVTK